MEDAFFNGSARGYLGHFPFLNIMSPLRAFYTGTPHVYLFDTFSTIVYRVPMRTSQVFAVKGDRIANAVGYILDELALLRRDAPPHVAYLLGLYEDMFIPMMTHLRVHPSDDVLLTDMGEGAPIERLLPDDAFHVGKLPDCVHLMMQCSFWNDSKTTPLVHILTKCTPQRCQIRSLAGIIYNYSRLHDDVYLFMRAITKASMLGVYEGSIRPALAVRRAIVETLDNLTRDQFLDWMQKDHQQFLFFAVKEYIVFATQHIPSLHQVLRSNYRWDEFEKVVRRAMNGVRRILTEDILVLTGVEQCIRDSSRGSTHMYRPRKTTFCRVLIQECERYCETRMLETEYSTLDKKHAQLMYQMLIRATTHRIPFTWLQCFGVSKAQTSTLVHHEELFCADGARGKLRDMVQKMDVYLLERVRALAHAFFKKFNVRVFTLPMHVSLAQVKALRNMHNIPNGQPVEEIGSTYVCFECKQFRGFVTHRCGKRIHNLCAFGHNKVLIDDVASKLYCGRRFDKLDKKRASRGDLDEALEIVKSSKQTAKDKRKEKQMELCATTELQPVNLVGNILQFYGNLYTICTRCGNYMKYDPLNFDGNIFCGCCVEDGVMFRDIRCNWCRGKTHISKPITVKEGKIFLCRSCYKPWIRNATAILSTAVIRQGLEEKWKRLQGM
jgi:hypothetical protein